MTKQTKIIKYKSLDEKFQAKLLELFHWYEKESIKESKLKTIKY